MQQPISDEFLKAVMAQRGRLVPLLVGQQLLIFNLTSSYKIFTIRGRRVLTLLLECAFCFPYFYGFRTAYEIWRKIQQALQNELNM
jgi:hypothetical protein